MKISFRNYAGSELGIMYFARYLAIVCSFTGPTLDSFVSLSLHEISSFGYLTIEYLQLRYILYFTVCSLDSSSERNELYRAFHSMSFEVSVNEILTGT